MSSTYTGVAGNIPNLASITETIPADADALSAASVNTALQKLADYLSYITTIGGRWAVPFLLNPGNAASTSYWAWACASAGTTSPATNPTASTLGATGHGTPDCKLKFLQNVGSANNVLGGTVTVEAYDNGVATGNKITMTAGQNLLTGTLATVNYAMSIGHPLELKITNGVGVTASTGIAVVLVILAPA